MAGPFFQDAFKAFITAALVAGNMKYCAVGTGAGPATAAATALSTEVETRVAGTQTQQLTTVANDTYQVVGTVTMTAPRVITESGLFDQLALGGNMGIGYGHAAINLGTGDGLQNTFKLAFS